MKALSGPFLGGGFGKALADTLLVFKDFIHYSSPECHIKFPNPESCIIMTRSGSQLASVSTKQLRLRTRFCLVNLHLHIPIESTHARAPHVSIISCSKSNRFTAIAEDYRFDLGDAAADYSLSELYDEFISSAIFVGQPIHAPASAYAQKQLYYGGLLIGVVECQPAPPHHHEIVRVCVCDVCACVCACVRACVRVVCVCVRVCARCLPLFSGTKCAIQSCTIDSNTPSTRGS